MQEGEGKKEGEEGREGELEASSSSVLKTTRHHSVSNGYLSLP